MTAGPLITKRGVTTRAQVIGPPGFVGRERELGALSAALAGGQAVVLIEGEAGIGKSTLLREYLASSGEGRRALVGRCPPFRQPHTLGPVTDAVRQATDRVTRLPLSALSGALRPLFPEGADDLPPAPEPAEDPTAARHRLFRALAELAGCLQVRLLVLEDAQWADEATIEFLLFLATQQRLPVSLVVTCRPEDVAAGSLLLRLSRGWTETAWGNGASPGTQGGSGPGCSAYVAKPAYQHDPDCKMRTIADVSADADPNTGLAVYDTIPNPFGLPPGWIVVGGTSASSPFIAGVIGLAGNASTYTPGFSYKHNSALFDVVGGSNGFCGGGYLCTGVKRYDGPTGLGTPKGAGAF